VLNDISVEELNLTPSQLAKFNRLNNNIDIRAVFPIKIGNIPSLHVRGALPVKLPGENKPYLFKSDRAFTIRDLGAKQNVLIEHDLEMSMDRDCASDLLDIESNVTRTIDNSRADCNVINVLVLYTSGVPNDVNPQNEAVRVIDETNQALRNSDIDIEDALIRLAGVAELTSFTPTTDIEADYLNLIDNTEAQGKRDNYAADVAILFTPNNQYANAAGVASADGYGDEDHGYAIVEVGNPSYFYTFSHELMHILGCRHRDDPDGTFEHAHVLGNGQGTIVAANTETTIGVHVPYYSNPDVWVGGVRYGVPAANDNASKIRLSTPVVAGYWPACEEPIAYITGPWHLENNTSGTWCSNIVNCSVTQRDWYVSTYGFNYTKISGGACITRTLTNNNDLFIRLEVSCANGLSTTAFFHVVNEDNPSCDPCFGAEKKVNKSDRIRKVQVSPSITEDHTMVSAEITKHGFYVVYVADQMGNKLFEVYSGELNQGERDFRVNVENLIAGMKYLVIRGDDDVITKRFFVSNNM
jgi:hypothetical protein